MNNTYKKKAGFIAKSLLWSVLLYLCAACVLNWSDITGKSGDTSVVYTNSRNSSVTSVKISIDSLQKRIHFTDIVLQYLQVSIMR